MTSPHGGGPKLRPAIADIPAYVPGKPPAVREGFDTYKLSSNENPYPPLPEVLDAATRAAASMNRYPDMGCTALYSALSAHLDVPTSNLAAGTGSVAVLYHLLQALCEAGDEVVHAWRSFEAYPIAVAVTGAAAVKVPLDSQSRHDLDAMAGAIGEHTKAVIICTPNNPTGPAIGRQALEAFIDSVPAHVLVIVDEAYREFVRIDDPLDAITLCRDRQNVAVMRTFAKAYGMAGLRVGYVVATAPIAAAVRACALPFGVSSIAQAAAVAALDHEPALFERVDALVTERDRVVTTLRQQGWTVPEAQGNFVWLGLGESTSAFAAAADRAGVMVRPFADEGARISIGDPAGNDIFLAVATDFVP